MSDRLPHPDEIVSAYLDGELTPVEAAAVEADETLAARAQELRAVRDAVAAPVPAPSTELRDQMIAAAMDAASDATALGGVVVPLRRTLQPLLAVAATVVAIAAVVGAGLLASRLGGGDDSDTASEAPAAEFDRSESAGTADSAAPEPTQAPATVMADDGFAYDEAMAEEPMAEEELMDEMQAAPESPDLDAAAAATKPLPTKSPPRQTWRQLRLPLPRPKQTKQPPASRSRRRPTRRRRPIRLWSCP